MISCNKSTLKYKVNKHKELQQENVLKKVKYKRQNENSNPVKRNDLSGTPKIAHFQPIDRLFLSAICTKCHRTGGGICFFF
jgi:hypothetical protein